MPEVWISFYSISRVFTCKSKLKSGASLACVHILHVQSSEHDRKISKDKFNYSLIFEVIIPTWVVRVPFDRIDAHAMRVVSKEVLNNQLENEHPGYHILDMKLYDSGHQKTSCKAPVKSMRLSTYIFCLLPSRPKTTFCTLDGIRCMFHKLKFETLDYLYTVSSKFKMTWWSKLTSDRA